MAKLTIPLACALLIVLSAVAPIHAQEMAEGSAGHTAFDRSLPRILYRLDYDRQDAQAGLVARAFEAALREGVRALWIAPQADGVGETAAMLELAEAQQALALARFVLTATDADHFSLTVQITAVEGARVLVELGHQIEADRGGRFMAAGPWRPAVEAIAVAVDSLSPMIVLTVRSTPGALIEGFGEPFHLDAHGFGRLSVPRYTSFLLTISAAGHRTLQVPVYVERTSFEVGDRLYRYPRHSVALFARELSYPSVEYAYHAPRGNVLFTAGLDTYVWGVTPMRNVTGGYGNPSRLFTSLPLSQLTVTAGGMSGDRDSVLRAVAQIGAFVRFVHGGGLFGLEPVMPAGLTLRLGLERELSQWFFLSASVGNDLFWPVRMDFLPRATLSPFVQRIGPFVAQLGLIRLGVRVVLP